MRNPADHRGHPQRHRREPGLLLPPREQVVRPGERREALVVELVVVRHVARERHVGRHRRVVAVVVGQRRQVEPGQEGHDDDRVDQPGAPAAQPGQQLRVDPRPPGGGPRRGCPARRRPLGLLGGGRCRLLPPPGAAAPQPDRDRGREPAEQDGQDGRGDQAGLERARRAGVAVVGVDGDREVGRGRAREGSERRRQRVDVGERGDRLGGGLRVGRDVLDLVGVGLAEPRCELAEGPTVAAHGHPGRRPGHVVGAVPGGEPLRDDVPAAAAHGHHAGAHPHRQRLVVEVARRRGHRREHVAVGCGARRARRPAAEPHGERLRLVRGQHEHRRLGPRHVDRPADLGVVLHDRRERQQHPADDGDERRRHRDHAGDEQAVEPPVVGAPAVRAVVGGEDVGGPGLGTVRVVVRAVAVGPRVGWPRFGGRRARGHRPRPGGELLGALAAPDRYQAAQEQAGAGPDPGVGVRVGVGGPGRLDTPPGAFPHATLLLVRRRRRVTLTTARRGIREAGRGRATSCAGR